jgi:protoheme IX farnesyltransferase
MKKVHPVAVLIGAVPGAFTSLIGWVAATGSFGIGGWVLFSLQFFWQFPHFWAIAWVAFDDYQPGRYSYAAYKGKRNAFYRYTVYALQPGSYTFSFIAQVN